MPKFSEIIAQNKSRIGPELSQTLSTELRSARDDIRRSVVEEGWFGKPITEASATEATTVSTPQIETGNSLYEEVWGEEPETEDLYGTADTNLTVEEPVEATPENEPEPDLGPEL